MRQNHPHHFSHNVDWHFYKLIQFLSHHNELGLIYRYIYEKQFRFENIHRPLQKAGL